MPQITLGPHPHNHTGVVPKNAQGVLVGIINIVPGGAQQATIGFSQHNTGHLPIPVQVQNGAAQAVNGVNFGAGNFHVTYANVLANSPTVQIAWQ